MSETLDREERMWATFCHLGTFVGYVFPFGHIIAPLVIWLLKREEYPLVDDQGKESLNFQISITIYLAIAGLLSLIVVGIPLLFGVLLWQFVAVVVAAIRANDGERFRYAGTLRFIR